MVKTNGKKIDHLTEDELIPGQRFVCLSFVSPEGIRNCTTRGLKVRGVYPTYQEAQERCKELQTKDSDFDIFIGEVGKWCPWDPDPNSAKDQQYQEEELQKLVEGYKNNLTKAQKLQEERKKEMINKAANDEQSKLAKRKRRMKKKLEEKNAKKALDDLADVHKNGLLSQLEDEPIQSKTGGKKMKTDAKFEGQDEVAKQERERILNNQHKIEHQQKTVNSVDEKLAKIQSLYNKLNKKKEEASTVEETQ